MKLSLTAKQNIFGFFFGLYVAIMGLWIAVGMAAIHWMQLITWHEYALVCVGLLGGVGLFALWAYYGFYRHRSRSHHFVHMPPALPLSDKAMANIPVSKPILEYQLQDMSKGENRGR